MPIKAIGRNDSKDFFLHHGFTDVEAKNIEDMMSYCGNHKIIIFDTTSMKMHLFVVSFTITFLS